MRIGVVSGEFPPAVGGVGDHTARLGLELSGAGHTVEVLTSASPSAPPDRQVAVLRLVARWDWRILLQVPRIARQRRWDVLHIQYQPAMYGLHGAINLLPWVLRGRLPAVVTTFHDLRFPYLFPKAGGLRTMFVAALAKGSDGVIAVSDGDLPALLTWRRRSERSSTQHIPLGDQLDASPPSDLARAAWRGRLGLPATAPLVAYFGLMNESKGVIDLIDALAQTDGVCLVIVGEALGASDATNRRYLAAVRDRITALKLADRVAWTGYVAASDVAGWLDIADLVALPFADGASLRRTSLIAAWRRGRPVVTTTPAAESPALDAARDAAAYVPPRDPEALARAIEALVRDPTLRTRLGAAGARYAERFSWPSVVQRTLEVYDAALNARRV